MTDIQTFWEAFGVSEGLAPHGLRVMSEQPNEPFPEAEIHKSITHIEIELHGDDPKVAFIHVIGIDEEAVGITWRKTAKMVRDHWKECWQE